MDEFRESTETSYSVRGDGVPLLTNCSEARYETKSEGSSTGVIRGIMGELGDMPFSIDMRSRGSLGAGWALVTIRMAGGGEGVEVRAGCSGEAAGRGIDAGAGLGVGAASAFVT